MLRCNHQPKLSALCLNRYVFFVSVWLSVLCLNRYVFFVSVWLSVLCLNRHVFFVSVWLSALCLNRYDHQSVWGRHMGTVTVSTMGKQNGKSLLG